MLPNDEAYNTLKEHRDFESKLHGELMDICHKYTNKLGIVSILGILEIVKHEVMELEQATRKDI